MKYFDRNLRTLKRSHQDFNLPLDELPGDEHGVEIIEAASGEVTAVREGILLHSKLDPRREARRLIANLDHRECVVFFGFGLGFYVEEYLSANPKGAAIVVEPDPVFFKTALAARNLTGVLESPGLSLVLGAEPDALGMVLNSVPFSHPGVVAPRSLVRFHEEYFGRLNQVIESFVSRREVNRNTLKRFGKRWVRNLAANLHHLPVARRLKTLEGRFPNIPALVLAAGPSLDSVIEYLPALSKRFLLFAVDTSLRAVLRAGVAPDFLVVVDPQYWNFRHLDGCSTAPTVLITESATYPAVFRRPYRAVFLGASIFPLGTALETGLGDFGVLGAGGSVATSAWDAARQMGCSPIYSAGLDLGYPGANTHFKGGRFEELQMCSSTRFLPAEAASFSTINNAEPFLTESNSGKDIVTDRRLIIYKWWFENQLKMYGDTRCGNLSADGVKIDRMPYIPVADLLSFPEISAETRAEQTLIASPNGNSGAQLRKNLQTAVSGLVADLHSLRTLAERACTLTEQLEKGQHSEIRGVLEKLDRIDRELLSHKAKDVAGFLIQHIAQDILDGGASQADITEIADRSRRMYENLKESADYHIEILSRCSFDI